MDFELVPKERIIPSSFIRSVTLIPDKEGMDAFVEFCKQYFSSVLEVHLLAGYDEKSAGIPKDYLVNYLIGTFMETIRWWAKNDMKQQ